MTDNSNLKVIAELRQRILDGETPSNDDLRVGLLAIRAERRENPPSFLQRLRQWRREAPYWLRCHKEDEANARLAAAAWAAADAQERMCDDY